MPDNKIEDSPLVRFVRALARNQARLDAAAGVQFKEINRYRENPSPENAAGVQAHMAMALEMLRIGK